MSYLELILASDDPDFLYRDSVDAALESFYKKRLIIKLDNYKDIFSFKECLSNKEELEEIKAIGDHLGKFKKVLVCGIGGSALNGEVFASFIDNDKFIFINNIDPFSFEYKLKNLDLTNTGIIIISKSGNTPEVISQTLCLFRYIKDNYHSTFSFSDNLVLITTRGNNFLTKFSEHVKPKFIFEHKKIGGRYSIFTTVGLLISHIAGLENSKIIEGADRVIDHFLAQSYDQNLLIRSSCETFALYKEKFDINVMMVYLERYKLFTKWFRQLYAESLGKDGKGIIPIDSIGSTDQHSQLQLYLEGPEDKYFTFLSFDCRNLGIEMDSPFIDNASTYLNHSTMGDLYYFEKVATVQTVKEAKLPVREIKLSKLDETELGSLLMHYMIENILLGFQMEINPFDQPSIEHGKFLAQKYLQEEKMKNL